MDCNVEDFCIDIAIERKTSMGKTVLEEIQQTYFRAYEYQRQQGITSVLDFKINQTGFWKNY